MKKITIIFIILPKMTQSRFEEPSSPSDLLTPTFDDIDHVFMIFDDSERTYEDYDGLGLFDVVIEPPQLYVPNNNNNNIRPSIYNPYWDEHPQ